jgi:hypothetical protein
VDMDTSLLDHTMQSLVWALNNEMPPKTLREGAPYVGTARYVTKRLILQEFIHALNRRELITEETATHLEETYLKELT